MNEHPVDIQDAPAGPDRSIGGIVLCGGDSTRMGQDKAWLAFGEETLLQRIVRITAEAVSIVVVAARPGQALPPMPENVLIVHDAVCGRGPLAGVVAGFEALSDRCDAAFVTSCDHPLLRPTVIQWLIEALGEHRAVVPVHNDRWYPLTAVYRLETLPLLQEALASGNWAVRGFARRCDACLFPAERIRCVDPDLDFLCNVNDQDGYAHARRALGL